MTEGFCLDIKMLDQDYDIFNILLHVANQSTYNLLYVYFCLKTHYVVVVQLLNCVQLHDCMDCSILGSSVFY